MFEAEAMLDGFDVVLIDDGRKVILSIEDENADGPLRVVFNGIDDDRNELALHRFLSGCRSDQLASMIIDLAKSIAEYD